MSCNCRNRGRACQQCHNRCRAMCTQPSERMYDNCARSRERGYYRNEPSQMDYARAYIRYQRYENVYDAGQALSQGTAFADLDMPEWQ